MRKYDCATKESRFKYRLERSFSAGASEVPSGNNPACGSADLLKHFAAHFLLQLGKLHELRNTNGQEAGVRTRTVSITVRDAADYTTILNEMEPSVGLAPTNGSLQNSSCSC